MSATLAHLLNDARFRESLLTQHLPAFLNKQRWYTSKGQTIDRIELTPLPTNNEQHGLWLMHTAFASDTRELRVLAVAEVERQLAPDDLRLICPTPSGWLVDACGEESFRESLYQLMAQQQRLQSSIGTLYGTAGSVCTQHPNYQGSNMPPQNSSNTVIAYEPNGFFKLFRKTEAGLHPDAELIGYLSKECNFGSVPSFGGAISFQPDGDSEPITLGLMLGKIEHRGEAWETMLHAVSAYAKTYQDTPELQQLEISDQLDEPLRRADVPEVLAKAVGHQTLLRIELLGKRTAEMHLHLGQASNAGMQPQALDDEYWASAKTALLERLRSETEFADKQTATALRSITSWLENTKLPRLEKGCIRVHGDYHLGQVLDTTDDVVIIDFEGEPLHSLEYRRRRHPASKDVAGMIRSLNYAPYAHALQELDGARWAMDAAGLWYHTASRLFLTAYFDRVGEASFLPPSPEERLALLAFFLVDKALYELAYERASRPAWMPIPATGVVGVATLLGAKSLE